MALHQLTDAELDAVSAGQQLGLNINIPTQVNNSTQTGVALALGEEAEASVVQFNEQKNVSLVRQSVRNRFNFEF